MKQVEGFEVILLAAGEGAPNRKDWATYHNL